jgi:hypothetical protein
MEKQSDGIEITCSICKKKKVIALENFNEGILSNDPPNHICDCCNAHNEDLDSMIDEERRDSERDETF